MKKTYDRSWDVSERSMTLTLHMRCASQDDMADDLMELSNSIRMGEFPPERWRSDNCPHESELVQIRTVEQDEAQEAHDRRMAEQAREFKRRKSSQ
ncbi:MAG: hypothetical protein AAFX90_09970 [Pseudomonadota bacterium]